MNYLAALGTLMASWDGITIMMKRVRGAKNAANQMEVKISRRGKQLSAATNVNINVAATEAINKAKAILVVVGNDDFGHGD